MKADPRYGPELPMPCLHCKNLVSSGNQFEPDGWTCKAYPDQILYTILTNRQAHHSVELADTQRLQFRLPDHSDANFFFRLINSPGWKAYISDKAAKISLFGKVTQVHYAGDAA